MDILLYFIVFAVALAGALFFVRHKTIRKTILIGGAVILCLELFVFNYAAYGIFFGKYKTAPVNLLTGNAQVSGMEGSPLSGDAGTDVHITLPGLSQPVYDVKIDMVFQNKTEADPGTPFVEVAVDAMDDTNSADYRYDVANGTVVRDDAGTAFLRLNLSGNVKALRLRFHCDSGFYTVSGLTLNAPIPLHLSLLRSALLFGVVLLFCLFLYLARSGKTYGAQPLMLRRLVFFAALVFLIGSLAVMQLSCYDDYGTLPDFGGQESGNQITQELVDAFESGQVTLQETPGEDLLALENPYDWSQRSEADVYAKWDHLLFNGKYYSYYGIAPVLLLFLPFHLLTGLYFSTPLAVLLFGGIGIVFLSLLFIKICDLWCARVPTVLLFCSYLLLLSSSGIYYCFAYLNFYEIAQSSGFMFTAAGFYFLLCSNVVFVPAQQALSLPTPAKEKVDRPIRLVLVALSGCCLSLAVLCRPTLALYCVIALIFLWFGLTRKLREVRRAKGEMKLRKYLPGLVPYLLCALLPFALIGGVQMIYNYIRFGSFTDFGIQYSLTINDFTRSAFHLDFVTIGFYNFLFAFPHFLPRFPFVASDFSELSMNGYYFIANRNAIGLFWKALPAWGIFALPFAAKKMTRDEKKQTLCLLLPLSVIAPFIIIFSIWESGYGVRYGADFNWQILLGGLLCLFLFYNRCAERQLKRLLVCGFCFSAVCSLWMNTALMYEYIDFSKYLADAALSFARLFDFWI